MIQRDSMRTWRVARACALAAAAAVSCAPIASAPDTAPQNACPAFPCGSADGGSSPSAPMCQAGTCVVSPSAASSNLIVVVAVPDDSLYAPGRTFALTFADLLTSTAANGCNLPDCCIPDCAPLPVVEVINRSYVIPPALEADTSSGVDFYLGNAAGANTALPIHATYQPLWPPGIASAQYATSLGLPLEPIQALALTNPIPVNPGPSGGPSIVVETYLQIGTSYELTDLPDLPFSGAYPPEVPFSPFTVTGPENDVATVTQGFDVTKEETDLYPGQEVIPTFDISRAAGLDGFTAYLRDATNLNTLSNVATLSGTEAPNVRLATNRFGGAPYSATTDALVNAQLVIAAPTGAVVPTGIFTPAGGELPAVETYPAMPAAVSVSGAVSAAGIPAEADLTLEATAILVGGTFQTANFTYTAWASASIDSTTGGSAFSVPLPPGQYLVVARPSSGANEANAVTLQSLDVPDNGPFTAETIPLAATQVVFGTVTTPDGRSVSEATVDAIPTACAPLPSSLMGTTFLSTTICLPRPAQTITTVDGTFSLTLDPGGYLLRVRPAEGTRFPWVTRSISVAAEVVALDPIVVPIPTSVGLRLVDPNKNPIVRAVVSVYTLPAVGQAVELGSALTDDSGQYEMFVALPQP